jgi:hypothetical protein
MSIVCLGYDKGMAAAGERFWRNMARGAGREETTPYSGRMLKAMLKAAWAKAPRPDSPLLFAASL